MLEILDPGIGATIQDPGRNGYQQYGVTRGGAMDTLALRVANSLVGNEERDACIEIASGGFSVRAVEKCVVGVAGAGFALRVIERRVPVNSALFLRGDEVLTFDAAVWGRYAYLAVPGGIDAPVVLGSRATALRDNFGGFEGRALQVGDVLTPRVKTLRIEYAGKTSNGAYNRFYSPDLPMRILFGPHAEFFEPAAQQQFLQTEFVVSELSDRMGMRLVGQPVVRAQGEVLSCGITRGAIQVPPDGQPIVLQADHQTAGGYPILGAVIRADIPRLAQKRSGERVTFRESTRDAALDAWRELQAIIRSE